MSQKQKEEQPQERAKEKITTMKILDIKYGNSKRTSNKHTNTHKNSKYLINAPVMPNILFNYVSN